MVGAPRARDDCTTVGHSFGHRRLLRGSIRGGDGPWRVSRHARRGSGEDRQSAGRPARQSAGRPARQSAGHSVRETGEHPTTQASERAAGTNGRRYAYEAGECPPTKSRGAGKASERASAGETSERATPKASERSTGGKTDDRVTLSKTHERASGSKAGERAATAGERAATTGECSAGERPAVSSGKCAPDVTEWTAADGSDDA
jgi:hypothetical protein